MHAIALRWFQSILFKYFIHGNQFWIHSYSYILLFTFHNLHHFSLWIYSFYFLLFLTIYSTFFSCHFSFLNLRFFTFYFLLFTFSHNLLDFFMSNFILEFTLLFTLYIEDEDTLTANSFEFTLTFYLNLWRHQRKVLKSPWILVWCLQNSGLVYWETLTNELGECRFCFVYYKNLIL